MPMRLVGYVRVSRIAGREGESFISTSVQRERCEGFAQAHGHAIIAWHEDLDQPGSHMNRPGFIAAMNMIRAGEADGIIVARLNRFARSILGAAIAIRDIEEAGGHLVAVDLGVDPSSPTGNLTRTILLALAEFELETIRESWAVARKRAISRGVHISRVPPVGYIKLEDSRLEPDPAVAPVIRELFLRRAAGEGYKQLAAWLNDALPRKTRWSSSTVHGIIGARVYVGEAHSGEIVNAAAHDPIVSRDEWDAAQNVRTLRVGRRGDGALLAGLIRCRACGQRMSRTGGGARGYTNYGCRRSFADGICPEPSRVSCLKADAHVNAVFLDWLSQHRVEVMASSHELELADAAVAAAEQELVAYRDSNLVSVVGEDVYLDGMRERATALDAARAGAAEVRARVNADGIVGQRFSLQDEWPSLTVREKRHVLAAAIDSVFVRRAHLRGQGTPVEDRLCVVWRGDGNAVEGLRRFVFPDELPADVAVAGSQHVE